MATIYLMRHGAVDSPEGILYGPERPLSDAGRQQVAQALERLSAAGIAPVAVIASPYVRTQQTAEMAVQALGGIPLGLDERLHEWDIDGWFNKPLEDFYRHTGLGNGAIVTDFPPDIESYPHLADRMAAALRDAVATYPTGDLLIISHGEPIACVSTYLQGLPWEHVRTEQIRLAEIWRCQLAEDGSAQVTHAF